MNRTVKWDKAFLALLLLIELIIFTGSFDKFFNHDSLFYLIHTPRSLEQFKDLFLAPDATQQYRPLTLGTMALFVPHFGLDHRRYHLIPIIFHLLNTILFFQLCQRLLPDRVSWSAATAFWALHSVAGWITYGITYISDFLMAFFALGCLILAVEGERRRSPLWIAGSMVLFMAALLSKEAALALPIAVLFCLGLARLPTSGAKMGIQEVRSCLRESLPLTAAFLPIAVAYGGLLVYWMSQGLLYPQSPSTAYAIDPLSDILSKARYFYWALNLPEALHIDHPYRMRALALLLLAIPLILWVADLVRRRGRLSATEGCGLIWMVGLLGPALMLSNRLAKWYLYFPLTGVAIAFGSFAYSLRETPLLYARRWGAAAVLAILLLPNLFSSIVQTRSFLRSSDSAYASSVVQACLEDFQRQNPVVPDEMTLYVLPTFEKNVAEFFGEGRLYELFHPQKRIHMLFADRGDRLPSDFEKRPEVRVLQYMYGHVYDVTDYYRSRRSHHPSRRLVPSLDVIQVSVSRDEYYPDYSHFDTPGGSPAFFSTPGKEILTQVGGSTVTIPVGVIPSRATLCFDVSWMFDSGDGAWAEMSLRAAGEETILFREFMDPKSGGSSLRWKEVRADLGQYENQKAELVLRCRNEAGKTTISDWLNWRDIALEVR